MKNPNKFEYVKVIQGCFAGLWEDVSEYGAEISREDIRKDLKEYRYRSEYAYRLISRRNLVTISGKVS
jgi:hypothetical protein